MEKIRSISWGVEALDKSTGGIPQNLMSIIDTPDYHTGNVILGEFLYDGLKNNEKCVLITFDSAQSFLENFGFWDMNFKSFLDSEQFVLLNYQPNITYEAGLTHDYDAIFEEVNSMCGGEAPVRIAIQQVDTLVNLNNQVVMNMSTQKLCAAGNSAVTSNTTILGQFVHFGDRTHTELSIAFQKTMPGYYSIGLSDPLFPSKLTFRVRKQPWFNYHKRPLHLRLQEGEGIFVDESANPQVA